LARVVLPLLFGVLDSSVDLVLQTPQQACGMRPFRRSPNGLQGAMKSFFRYVSVACDVLCSAQQASFIVGAARTLKKALSGVSDLLQREGVLLHLVDDRV
jgi:hypothetical protein